MKGFRKSLKNGDRQSSVLVNGVVSPKSSLSIVPPKKVIRALYDYEPQSNRELAFSRGDFFHVIGGENDLDWYEACNPATNARGFVPVPYFQVLGKTTSGVATAGPQGLGFIDENNRDQVGPDSGYKTHETTSFSQMSPLSAKPVLPQPVYGVVAYDFEAERQDELSAKKGEAIIVIAQSNHEWFVAKPIGRLGGPGLIPISFIEIRDVATGKPVENIQDFVTKSGVPKVEEWKKMTTEYKNNSIPLGKFDYDSMAGAPSTASPVAVAPSSPEPPLQRQASQRSYFSRQSSLQSNGPTTSPLRSPTTLLAVKEARIEQFSYTNGRYWYWIRAMMEDGRHRNLCRFYEDFYDFQMTLLQLFPVEAGKTGEKRIIPYIPGPIQYVTDSVADERRDDLDQYVRKLSLLPDYIKNHAVVKKFFSPREGDVESSRATNMPPQPAMYQERVTSAQLDSVQYANRGSTGSPVSESSRTSGGLAPPLSRGVGASNTYPNESGLAAESLTKAQSYNSTTSTSSSSRSRNNSDTVRLQPPFIKIKIFYQDDIIVIRTPPDVNYIQLTEKIQERCGPFSQVRYRDLSDNELYTITSDEELELALTASSKLVLYAD